jgi:hypothetical protein
VIAASRPWGKFYLQGIASLDGYIEDKRHVRLGLTASAKRTVVQAAWLPNTTARRQAGLGSALLDPCKPRARLLRVARTESRTGLVQPLAVNP